MRKAGGRVRITAQLIDGASGGHVWAERYDRDLNDIFALQDEISEAIVRALKLKLLPEGEEGDRAARHGQCRGLQALSDGATDLRHRQRRRCPASEAIIRLCRRATEIDPHYARAWALMADWADDPALRPRQKGR